MDDSNVALNVARLASLRDRVTPDQMRASDSEVSESTQPTSYNMYNSPGTSMRLEYFALVTHQVSGTVGPPAGGTSASAKVLASRRFMSINTIDDDVLLDIFNWYRLFDEENWTLRFGWHKLSRVCRRWWHLIYVCKSHLEVHILCTNGTPVDMRQLYLPRIPLVIDHQDATATMSAKDELVISRAFQIRDRVRRIALIIPPASLHRLLLPMDDTFPILERLYLSSTANEADAGLILPTTFMAPNLRHITLLGIGLPTGLHLLSSTSHLVTLTLANIQFSGYFLPKHLVARLRFLPRLEELSICFSITISRHNAEGELLGTLNTPVTLPALNRFTFQGTGAYLESLVAQLIAPHLDHLRITIFNPATYKLPHLFHFTNTTEGVKLPIAIVIFEYDAVSVVTNERRRQLTGGPSRFCVRIKCREFDKQVICAAHICNSLMPALSGVKVLTLDIDGQRNPTKRRNNVVEVGTWHKLLRPFFEATELRICHALSLELSLALQSDNAGLDPILLPNLQELIPQLEEEHANNAFGSFVNARQIAGHPVSVSPSQVPCSQPGRSEQRNFPEAVLASRPCSTLL